MYNNDEMYVESSHTDYNFADYNLIHYYTILDYRKWSINYED